MCSVSIFAVSFVLAVLVASSSSQPTIGFAVTLPTAAPSMQCSIQGNFAISSTPIPSDLSPGQGCNGTLYYLNDGKTIQTKAIFNCQWNFLSRGLEGGGFSASYDLYSSTTPTFDNISQVSVEVRRTGDACQTCQGLSGLAPGRGVCQRWGVAVVSQATVMKSAILHGGKYTNKCSMFLGSLLQQYATLDSSNLLQSYGWSFKVVRGTVSSGTFTATNCRATTPPAKLLVPSPCCNTPF